MSNSVGIGFSPSATGKSGWSTGGLGDLVRVIPGIGFNINNRSGNPNLGGGIRGIMPQPIVDHDNSDEYALYIHVSHAPLCQFTIKNVY